MFSYMVVGSTRAHVDQWRTRSWYTKVRPRRIIEWLMVTRVSHRLSTLEARSNLASFTRRRQRMTRIALREVTLLSRAPDVHRGTMSKTEGSVETTSRANQPLR